MGKEKIINSHWGVTLKSKVINQNSTTLVVLLPGIGYTVDRPLMDYSKRLALELEYNVLPIEYGFQIARKVLTIEDVLNGKEEVQYIKEESMNILKYELNKDYKKIVFISKSIGTVVHSLICKEIKNYEVKNIYLTPINKTLEVGIEENSLLISGTNDPLINKETIEKIRRIPGVKMIEVENGDHSLNIKGNVIHSIEVIHKIIKAEKEYLSE